MSNQQPDDNQLTVESCINKCVSLGYSVAGLQYFYQCFCDDILRNGAELASDDAQCNTACAGNSTQMCGGPNRNSVYTNNTELTVYPVPTQQKTNLTGSWQYSGCLQDNAVTRVLPYQIILSTNNSANNCISQCSDFGYNAGGLEFGMSVQ